MFLAFGWGGTGWHFAALRGCDVVLGTMVIVDATSWCCLRTGVHEEI